MPLMEKTAYGKTDLNVSRIVLGTWVTGGWAWGGTDDDASRAAILRSLELGINFIDTAPVYGFGKSEEVVGRALKEWGGREPVVVATKCGLEWDSRRGADSARGAGYEGDFVFEGDHGFLSFVGRCGHLPGTYSKCQRSGHTRLSAGRT